MNGRGHPGFRVFTDVPRTPPELVEAFRGKGSSDVADARRSVITRLTPASR